MFVGQPSPYGVDNTLKYLMQAANTHHDSFKALDLTVKKDRVKLKDNLHKSHSKEYSNVGSLRV